MRTTLLILAVAVTAVLAHDMVRDPEEDDGFAHVETEGDDVTADDMLPEEPEVRFLQ